MNSSNITSLKQAYLLNPHSVSALLYADALVEIHMLPEALTIVEKYSQHNPSHINAIVLLAQIFLKLNDSAKALALLYPLAYEKKNLPLGMLQTNISFIEVFAQSLTKEHRFEEALIWWRKAIKLNPYKQEYNDEILQIEFPRKKQQPSKIKVEDFSQKTLAPKNLPDTPLRFKPKSALHIQDFSQQKIDAPGFQPLNQPMITPPFKKSDEFKGDPLQKLLKLWNKVVRTPKDLSH